MAGDADRGPARWGLVVLGLLLAPTGVIVGLGVLADVLSPHNRWPPLALLAVAGILAALVGTIVTGARLLALATGGEEGRTARAWRALRAALILTGSLAALAALAVLTKHREGRYDTVAVAVLVPWAVVSLLLARVAGRRARDERVRGRREPALLAVCSLPLLLLLASLAVLLASSRGDTHADPPRPRSVTHARNLAVILSHRSIRRGWPPYGGRNFVLSLVPLRLVDVRNAENLELFFCRPEGEVIRPPPRAAYEALTQEALAEGRFPDLTDFAGRRNDEPEYALGEDAWRQGEPILAARIEDGVLIGFSDGRVRYLDREDLGLGPDDPIVFGDASPSPLLRTLSER